MRVHALVALQVWAQVGYAAKVRYRGGVEAALLSWGFGQTADIAQRAHVFGRGCAVKVGPHLTDEAHASNARLVCGDGLPDIGHMQRSIGPGPYMVAP